MRVAACLGLILSISLAAGSQELEPRAYRPLPSGLNFLVMSYQFTSGNVLADPNSPLQDLDVDAHLAAVGYMRTFGLFGRSASLSAAVPYVFMSGSATYLGEFVSDSRSGSADTRIRLAVNLLGGPAMSPREFAAKRPGRSLGVGLTVVPPTGQYDRTRLINFGSNRWAFKPELGYSSVRGRWILEWAAGVWLFTDNDEFAGSNTVSQEPVGNLQAHVTYSFERGVWIAAGANYYTGGRTSLNGIDRDDVQKNSRVGISLSLPLGGAHSLKLAAHSGAYTRAGADFDLATMAYQYRW